MPEWLASFIDAGGSTLWAILAVTIFMWTMIFERLVFYRWIFPRRCETWISEWRNRSDHSSWRAHAIRRLLVSEAKTQLREGIPIIKILIAICPLLGLLGTVTGMIEVFNVMAVTGGGDAKSMAGGVSMATIPTMAGMVGAISGIFASNYLKAKVDRDLELLEDHLPLSD